MIASWPAFLFGAISPFMNEIISKVNENPAEMNEVSSKMNENKGKVNEKLVSLGRTSAKIPFGGLLPQICPSFEAKSIRNERIQEQSE